MLSKPIYVRFTVLELRKWLMHDFHYNFIKNILVLNCYLLTQTVLRMKSNQKMFMKKFLSTSIDLTLEKDSKVYDNQNEMVVGKMKVVNKGIPINKFVRLK